MRKKVTIVGAGNTGATMAQMLSARGYADVVLIDIVEGLPQGKALDIAEANPWIRSSSSLLGTNDWADTAGSELVIVTSGVARMQTQNEIELRFRSLEKTLRDVRSVLSAPSGGVAVRPSGRSTNSERGWPPRS